MDGYKFLLFHAREHLNRTNSSVVHTAAPLRRSKQQSIHHLSIIYNQMVRFSWRVNNKNSLVLPAARPVLHSQFEFVITQSDVLKGQLPVHQSNTNQTPRNLCVAHTPRRENSAKTMQKQGTNQLASSIS